MKKETKKDKELRWIIESLMARIWDNSKDKNTEKCYDDRDWAIERIKNHYEIK